MCLGDVGKLSGLVRGLCIFVMYSVLSITTRATPLSAVTMMWSMVNTSHLLELHLQ